MIRANIKRLVRSLYVMRCGYCLVSEEETGAEMTYDHFQPQSKGGSNDKDNLVYACHACNEFKGEYFGDTEETRLLHPLRDDLKAHLQQEPNGTLRGLTPLGEKYLSLLQLNRPPLILHRNNKQRMEQAIHQYESIDTRLDAIMERVQRIEKRARFRRR